MKQKHQDSDQELCRNDGIYPFAENNRLGPSSRTCFGIWFGETVVGGQRAAGGKEQQTTGSSDKKKFICW